MMTAEERERIKRETFVAEVEAFAELPSTNDVAIERAREQGCPKPLLVFAERQTAGRGRGANRWWADAGALTFSLLVDGRLAAHFPPVSLAMGVAVCETLRGLGAELDAGLKWPNDVYVAGRKVAGILIERPSPPESDVVIGIGLNVNNSLEAGPAEIAGAATSLRDLTRREHDLNDVLIQLLKRIEQATAAMTSNQDALRRRWRELCILEGRIVAVEAGNRRIAGMCLGIDDDGALVLETPTGPERCVAGVVRSIE